jgi:hypothetical protein
MSETNKPDAKTIASWVLIGWQRCWTADEVFAAAGYQPDWPHLHDEYPMFPEFTGKKSPVRAFISENWPRFAERLDRGIKTREQAEALIEILSKKVATKRPRRSFSASEIRQFRVTARDFGIAKEEQAVYAKRNDVGAFGWKVCK